MSRETTLFINLLGHSIAVLYTLYQAYTHFDDQSTFVWCLTTAAWISIAGYRSNQFIKLKADFKEVVEESIEISLMIKESVDALKKDTVKK